MWTPSRADLLVELCGSIEDDDVSLVEPSGGSGRAFEAYGANPGEDSDAADRAARAIADYIPMGQPILIGHHSERSARRDRGRIETNTRRGPDAEDSRVLGNAAPAPPRRHAKYKERPDGRH